MGKNGIGMLLFLKLANMSVLLSLLNIPRLVIPVVVALANSLGRLGLVGQAAVNDDRLR
jgi:hypothetical protein